MPQVKFTGLTEHLAENKLALSDIVHTTMQKCLGVKTDKRFHHFLPMTSDWFIFGPGRSEQYTLIEISLFAGRTTEEKASFIKTLCKRLHDELSITVEDIEVLLYEVPRENWGIYGKPCSELTF